MTMATIIDAYEEGRISKELISYEAHLLFQEAMRYAKKGDKIAQAKLLNDVQVYVRALAEICG